MNRFIYSPKKIQALSASVPKLEYDNDVRPVHFRLLSDVRGAKETGTNSEGAGFEPAVPRLSLLSGRSTPDYQSGALNLSANLPPRVALLRPTARSPSAAHLYSSSGSLLSLNGCGKFPAQKKPAQVGLSDLHGLYRMAA